ncbi:substrate-binding domain-containing protein [Anaerosacchariphilus polymeriproducens]|uniref:Helix-turn-helix domain-containing protein n=1 Tax=Anaerosacchariphilus polymeriproducens TaxID=1812858 RepID=A0A371AXF9_9FIRM|nr:helix-turn-helix transcriptional regulator [Anaerosacchariphilus polymeriproducens]RDU24254.1 helix-turn-helix domain-containing protein [Anaerosacchariphilus polymeriproducens]
MRENKVLTPEEVAGILKIAKNTVYELIKRGELTAYKVGNKVRVDQSDLNYYIQRSKGTSSKSMQVNSSKDFQTFPIQSTFTTNNDSQLILCGQDPSLDILANIIQNHPLGTQVLRSYIGSFSGLISLYYDRCQISASHLWDGDNDIYNVPYIRRLLPGIPCIILRIAKRTLGFYVASGNPKNIVHWSDLTRDDIIMINREKGAGTRVLLDENLRLLSIVPHNINGYNNEETSHLSIASTISRGIADVGMGNQTIANSVQNVDFIPLKTECYDIVIKKNSLDQPIFQLIYDIINSTEYKNALIGLGGYDTSETGLLVAET